MIITEKDLQMLHTMPPPPPGEPLLPGRENDLKLGELRGVMSFLASPPSLRNPCDWVEQSLVCHT